MVIVDYYKDGGVSAPLYKVGDKVVGISFHDRIGEDYYGEIVAYRGIVIDSIHGGYTHEYSIHVHGLPRYTYSILEWMMRPASDSMLDSQKSTNDIPGIENMSDILSISNKQDKSDKCLSVLSDQIKMLSQRKGE